MCRRGEMGYNGSEVLPQPPIQDRSHDGNADCSPIILTNWVDAVATPTISLRAVHWTARVYTTLVKPKPMPGGTKASAVTAARLLAEKHGRGGPYHHEECTSSHDKVIAEVSQDQ